jgi:hypothetical protein
MKARDLRASIFDLADVLRRPCPGAGDLSFLASHRECMRRDSPEPVYEAASRYALKYVFGRKPEASR